MAIGVSFSNRTRELDSIIWTVNGSVVRASALSSKAGVDSILIAQTSPKNPLVSVRIRDGQGTMRTVAKSIEAYTRPPRVFAGRDTTLLQLDSLELRPRVEPGSGRIVRWEWELNGNPYIPVSGGDTTVSINFPNASQVFRVRVFDEFGSSADDAMTVNKAVTGTIWRRLPASIPTIPGRNFKRSCAVFGNKAWIFLSSQDETGVRAIQAWSSTDAIQWSLINDSVPMPPRILRSLAVLNDTLFVMGGEKSMGGRSSFNDVWSTGDGLAWKRIAETSPLDTGNNGDIAYTKAVLMQLPNRTEVAGYKLRVESYNGDIWSSADGLAWSLSSHEAYRPDELGAAADWTGSGKYGAISWTFFCGIRGVKGAEGFLDNSLTGGPLTGLCILGRLVVTDGQTTLVWGLNNRNLLFRGPFPGDWPTSVLGLYPNCLIALGGTVIAIKGGGGSGGTGGSTEDAYFTR